MRVGGRSNRNPPTAPYRGQAAYVMRVTRTFTRKHRVRIPADATLTDPLAMLEWCVMLREARIAIGLDQPERPSHHPHWREPERTE